MFRYLEPVRMGLVTHLDGPSASLLNPARLTSAERGYAQFASWSGGEAQAKSLSTGIGFGRRVYLGLSASALGSTFEHTTASLVSNRFGAQLAFRIPLDDENRGSWSIGIGEATQLVNSFNVWKTLGYNLDLGTIWVPSNYPGGWRLEIGWAVRDLFPASKTVPDPSGQPGGTTQVDLAPWMTLASLSAESPSKRWTLFGEGAAGERYDPAYFDRLHPGLTMGGVRWYLPRLGARYRPFPFASLTLERLWSRYWAASATVGTGSWLPLRCEADLRMAQGPFLEYQLPERSGWSMAFNLRILW